MDACKFDQARFDSISQSMTMQMKKLSLNLEQVEMGFSSEFGLGQQKPEGRFNSLS